jgi:competence protein ComEC
MFISLIYTTIYVFYNEYTPHFQDNTSNFKLKVIKKRNTTNGSSWVVQYKNDKVLLTSKEHIELKSGTIIAVRGKLTKPQEPSVPNAFNYQQFLKYQRINYIIIAEEVTIIQNTLHINLLNEVVTNHLNQYPKLSSSYLKGFILGDSSDFDYQLKTNISKLGISHLFAISGLHISILMDVMRKAGNTIKIETKRLNQFILGFLVVYCIISSFMISILRSVSMELAKVCNDKFRLGLTNLDLLSIIFIVFLAVNPFLIHQLGFQLSFCVSFSLLIGNKVIHDYTNWWIQSFLVCTLATLSSFLFIVQVNYEINMWTFIINVMFVYLVGQFILPISFIVTLFKPLVLLYEPVINIYHNLTTIVAQVLYIPISYSKPHFLIMICFFAFTYILFRKLEVKQLSPKHLLFYVLFLGCWSMLGSISIEDQIYFLAVRNGESTVIKESFNRCNIVIDTGEGSVHEVTTFLKSIGIKTIHYLILTHGDLDHVGEAVSIMRHFQVLNIVTNQYDFSKGIETVLDSNIKSKVIRAMPNQQLHCGNVKLTVLGPTKDFKDTNQNSLVIYAELFGKTILFTGDIGLSAEEELINQYNNLEFDILKVAHHGSITSTTTKFLDNVSFQDAVIMTGMYNRFGFPHQIILDRLQPYRVYRTDLHKTIVMKKLWINQTLNDPVN